jgi:serine/threonine-protein kinase
MILELLGWVATAGHVSDARSEWRLIIQALAGALLAGAVSWLLYMALEPFVRRRNPRLIIAWSRLLSGRWRDPLVGRDLMLGISAASLIVCLEHAFRFALYRLDRTVPQPLAFSTDFLAGPGAMLGATANIAINAVIEAMLLNFLFVALAALVRREWIAGVLFGGVLLISTLGGEAGSPVVYYTMQVIGLTLLVVVIARCGLLTLMGATLTMGMLRTIPLTRNLDQWYAHGTIAAMVLVGGLAALGFWSAIGGRLAFAGARPRQTRAGPPSSETR